MFGKDKTSKDDAPASSAAPGKPVKGAVVDYFLADRENPEGPPVTRRGTIVEVINATCVDLSVETEGERDGLNDVVTRLAVVQGMGVGTWAWPSKA